MKIHLPSGTVREGEPVPGAVYRIRTLTPPQRLPREHCLTYLGDNKWNARPIAGTQTIDPRTIIECHLITAAVYSGPRASKNPKHYMNKVIR